MMRRFILLLVPLVFWPVSVSAQDTSAVCDDNPGDDSEFQRQFCTILEKQILPLVNDINVIMFKGPKYLARRLPSMQAMGTFGADMDLEKPGDFSISLGLMAGVFNGFNRNISSDFQRLPKTLPEPLPLPAISLGLRAALMRDLEVTGRFAIFPEFKVSTQDWDISGTLRIFGAGARYRLLDGHGVVPTLVTSAEVSYFTGVMEVGRGFTYNLLTIREAIEAAGDNVNFDWEDFRDLVNDEYRDENGGNDVIDENEDVMIGTYFHGAPILGWDIFQLSLEQRAVWSAWFWHPFLGLGLDAASGHVDSGVQLETDLRITRPPEFLKVAGNFREPVIPDQNVTISTEKVRAFGARGIVGWEFDLGSMFRLPMEAQYDFESGSYLGAVAVRFAWH